MRTPVLCGAAAILLVFASGARAVETRHEEVRATTPAQDAKANRSDVPDVYAVQGNFQRVVVLRFKYQADLLAGLEKEVKDLHIRNGAILGAIGSVRGYSLHTVSNRTLPSKDLYFKDPDAPADIIGMSGFIINGRLHPHLALATPDRAFGGHLEPGTEVFTFAAVTIGVFTDDVDLTHLDDKNYR